jgi:hypothetical protein
MAEITAAAHPLMLAGREYFLSPLSDRDIEELNYWLQDQMIQMAVRNMAPELPQRTRDELMDAAMRQAAHLSWMSGEGSKQMRSLSGVARVAWQGLRRRHPELTHDDVKKLIMDPKTVEYVTTVFRKLNGRKKEVNAQSQDGAPQEEDQSSEQGAGLRDADGALSGADAERNSGAHPVADPVHVEPERDG